MKHPIDSRNKILLAAAAIISGLCFFTYGVRAQQAGTDQPNILFIYLDDLGYGDVTCYNPDSKIHTPHMDRLAKEGVFTDAHTPAAICGPSRYGLITGRYPWRRGKGGTGKEPDWFREERGVLSHRSSAELFNLKEDPQQTRNLSKKHPEKAKELKALLEQSRKAPQ